MQQRTINGDAAFMRRQCTFTCCTKTPPCEGLKAYKTLCEPLGCLRLLPGLRARQVSRTMRAAMHLAGFVASARTPACIMRQKTEVLLQLYSLMLINCRAWLAGSGSSVPVRQWMQHCTELLRARGAEASEGCSRANKHYKAC